MTSDPATTAEQATDDFDDDLDDYIRRLVDQAPPFSPERRARLAVLLRPPAHDTAA